MLSKNKNKKVSENWCKILQFGRLIYPPSAVMRKSSRYEKRGKELSKERNYQKEGIIKRKELSKERNYQKKGLIPLLAINFILYIHMFGEYK